MTQLVLLEPQDSIAWSPFLGVRPIAELRAGVWKIRERWEAALELETVAFSGAIQGFNEFDESRAPVELDAGRKIVVVRSDFVPLAQWAAGFDDSVALVHGGELVGWIMNQDEDPAKLPTAEVTGLWLRGAFDLVTALDKLAGPDCDAFLDRPSDPLPPQSIVLGDPSRIRILGAEVEPGVVFDVRHGAVIIEQGVCRRRRSAVLPRRNWRNPPRPCVPRTSRSTLLDRAYSTMPRPALRCSSSL